MTSKEPEDPAEEPEVRVRRNVYQLTPANFKNVVMKSDDIWLIYYFNRMSDQCKEVYPTVKATARRLKDKIKVGKIDLMETGWDLLLFEKQGTNVFPGFRYYPKGYKSEKLGRTYKGNTDPRSIR